MLVFQIPLLLSQIEIVILKFKIDPDYVIVSIDSIEIEQGQSLFVLVVLD